MKSIIRFIGGSFLGTDGKPSSKKLTAAWFSVLVTIVVLTLLVIAYLATFRRVELKDNTLRLLDMAINPVLLYLIGAILLLFGVQGWQQISSLKIMNPPPTQPPAKIETTINQPENANINNPSNEANK